MRLKTNFFYKMLKNIKKFFWVFLLSAFAAFTAVAQPAVEKGGKVILELDTENPDGDVHLLTFPEQVQNLLYIGSYFNQEYPGSMINWDFTEDMRKFFPNLSPNDLDDRVLLMRDAVRLYRYGYGLYQDIKQRLLVPEDPPIVYDDDAYEMPEKHTYVESDDLVVIPDFKRFVSYSGQSKDFKAYEAKIVQDQIEDNSDTSSPIKKINDMFAKITWKKFFFSLPTDKDPLTEGKGLGDWEIQDDVYVRLETEYASVNHLPSQKALLHFYLPADKVLRLDAPFNPTLNLNGDNLKAWTASLPVFARVPLGDKSYIGRTGHVPVAIILTLDDAARPLNFEAKVDAFICDISDCKKYTFSPKLSLTNEYGYSSMAYNFIHQSFLALPKSENDDISLLSLSVTDNPSELRLRIKTDENPSRIDVLLESDEKILFSEPRLSVNGDYVDAFLQADKALENPIGKTFDVTVKSSFSNAVRKNMAVEQMPPLDVLGSEFSWGLLLAALGGGLLLNFMPCVFPVLALKLMSVLRYGGANLFNVRKNFFYTLFGIFSAFSLLIIALVILKYLGVALGWGVQFQKPWFLVLMLFVAVLFLAYTFGLYNFNFAFKLKNYSFLISSEKVRFSLVGALIVLMSTPCTAPYLGTAIGFALSGSYSDIVLILYAVALGLSLPYILVAFIPELVLLLPKPGRWMLKVEWVMRIMLLLTLLWLFSILAAQVSFDVLLRSVLYVVLFAFILWGRFKLLSVLQKSPMTLSLRRKKYRIFSAFFLVVSLLLFGGAVFDVSRHFNSEANKVSVEENSFNFDKIQDLLSQGKSVLVKVDARWCLTCRFNDFTVLNTDYIQDKLKHRNIVPLSLDWTSYSPDILAFMKKYGRSSVPFYVLFSPKLPNGLVLPEVLTEQDFSSFLSSYSG